MFYESFFWLLKTPVCAISETIASITGTETLFPNNFIHLLLFSGRIKSLGKPCNKHASTFDIFRYLPFLYTSSMNFCLYSSGSSAEMLISATKSFETSPISKPVREDSGRLKGSV